MRKLILLFFLTAGFISFSFAQKIGVLNGPSGIPCAYLMENNFQNREFEICANAQTELPKLLKGELDFGFLPPNAAAKVFNKNNGSLLCLGVTGNGNLFVISKNGNENAGLKSLEGKTVFCAGQGATPEYLMRYLLEKNNIKNVTLDFSIPNPQLAPSLISGKADYILAPEPFPTVAELKDKDVIRTVDLQKEFSKSVGGTYPITVLVVNANFAKKNKNAVAKFIKDFEKAIQWTIENPREAGLLVEKNQLGLNATVAEKAIPNANFTWIPSIKAKNEIEKILKLFLDIAPDSIGGKLPSKKFYF